MNRRFNRRVSSIVLLLAFAAPPIFGQHTTALQPDATAPHRTRLFLKDGSYQIVMSYRIRGTLCVM